MEHYPEKDRWFLRSLLHVKDEEGLDGNDAIQNWLQEFSPNHLIVDCPISDTACKRCLQICPGINRCVDPEVTKIKKLIADLMEQDSKLQKTNPKQYEYDRNSDDLFDFSKDFFEKDTSEHILSRAFKRKLKKGYLPYWNRPVDVWIWFNYYDLLLKFFNLSFDSFGNISLMLLSRFAYLRRHFSVELNLYEGNIYLIIIELLRAKIIQKKDVLVFMDIERGVDARLDLAKAISEKFNIFIYDQELEILVKNGRAFESFLLALAGKNIHQNKIRPLPSWAQMDSSRFVVPIFKLLSMANC
ncbi:MAG: hypothetical protein A2451_00810 [Bdellovibrionales bacterium RIFOXYC2_FULL_39_8]|nr:MAG: hypothetical protein A2451_00810 [Bdellovibrionales bacterium RIFOXYC2_FULL_39_8]